MDSNSQSSRVIEGDKTREDKLHAKKINAATDDDDVALDHTLTIKPPQARVHKSRHKVTSHHKHSKDLTKKHHSRHMEKRKHRHNREDEFVLRSKRSKKEDDYYKVESRGENGDWDRYKKRSNYGHDKHSKLEKPHRDEMLKENDLRNLLQKKKMEKEERYRITDYKHKKKESVDTDSRDSNVKLKKREEEEERDSRRSHRERDQYIEQYYKTLDRPRPDMVPDLVVLSNDSSSSGSENENEEHEDENIKVKTEENSLTPPLNQDKSEGEASEESGQDSGDDTDSSGSTTSSSKSSQSSEKSSSSNSVKEESKSPEVDTEIQMDITLEKNSSPPLLPKEYLPALQGCRSVEEFQCLNRIEEGTYGVVYRAKEKQTDEIVALKRLKMEKEKEGFPITSLREISTLLKSQHPNIVTVREIVVGSNMDKIFIVMDYVEHDMKSLMETMRQKKQSFTAAEVKCLMRQLLMAVDHLHDNWILHRDLKTSNLLLSHKGVLKVGDFGLAREYGSPLKAYTPVVVTLWYRSPELLLGAKEYSTPIDIWSVGCIFAEFLLMEPLFTGKSEYDQLKKIFTTFGTPNEKVWPGYSSLSLVTKASMPDCPPANFKGRFTKEGILTDIGYDLLRKMLTYNPSARVTAEEALQQKYFSELPLAIDPAMFPTWPAKSEGGARKVAAASPKPPSGGRDYKQLKEDEGFHINNLARATAVPAFSLKF
ncbi:cyclin-dependent kinase 11B isoform X1 [Melanaphis sacchari]|uniref:cyclin-dependent kinase n=1 Tax=Melanaphis sacchari TaxID=742174 RepID=A0A2H8TS71_9HEMI|nr:cyclin-dependent kinase 11B isoform X1 [Melanaphis sacchari]